MSYKEFSIELDKIEASLQRMRLALSKHNEGDDDYSASMETLAKEEHYDVYMDAKKSLDYNSRKWSYSRQLKRPFYIGSLTKGKLTNLKVIFNDYMIEELSDQQLKYYKNRYPNRFIRYNND